MLRTLHVTNAAMLKDRVSQHCLFKTASSQGMLMFILSEV